MDRAGAGGRRRLTSLGAALAGDPTMSRAKTQNEKLFDGGVGRRIRQARKSLGYSQKQLGLLLGDKGNQSVSQYELGSQSPSPLSLFNIARALRVSADWLLGHDTAIEITGAVGVQEADTPFDRGEADTFSRAEWAAFYDVLTFEERQTTQPLFRELRRRLANHSDPPSGTAG